MAVTAALSAEIDLGLDAGEIAVHFASGPTALLPAGEAAELVSYIEAIVRSGA